MLIIEKLPTRYSEGSATVVANEVTVTPTDALWYGNVWGDDLFFDPAQPLVPPQRIASVNEDGTLTLAYPWPGDTMTEAPYEVRYIGIIERSTAQTRRVLEQLGEVKAWADIFVADEAARLALETESTPLRSGTRVLVVEDGEIWQKQSGAYGDWIGPVEFKGDTGDKGWSPQLAGEDDGERRVFKLVGYIGGEGAAPTANVGEYLKADGTFTATIGEAMDFRGESLVPAGDYNAGTTYTKGNFVQHSGSSWVLTAETSTGNAPPTLPTTSNAYWQLLARRGTDGAGTVTAVAAGQGIAVDDTDPTEPVVSLDIMGESVKTANYTLVAADYGGTFIADDTDPIEFAFEAAATLGTKWWAIVGNDGAGDLTLNPAGSETIDGEATLVLEQGQSCLVTCNGTDLRTVFRGGGSVEQLFDEDLTGEFNATQKAQARDNIGANLLGGFRNKLINALATINQRGYVSGAATSGANQYTLDRWRVVTSGQNLSWTESEGVRTMTAPAGGVEQVVEGGALLSGDYVLNWEGTATATVNGVARAKGEVFALTGGSNVTVRFSGGTFAKPQLEEGWSPSQFEVRHPQQEWALCQRYYQAYGAGLRGSAYGSSNLHVSITHRPCVAYRPDWYLMPRQNGLSPVFKS